MKGNTIWLLLVVGALLGFLIAKVALKTNVADVYINNPSMVRQIAELSTLEIKGEAKLNESNIGKDKTVWQDIKNYFGERTLLLNIPYTVKYGCKLGEKDIKVEENGKNAIKITMQQPELLSFELRADSMQQFTKNGLFVFQKDNKFKDPLQNLYNKTRQSLQKNTEYIQKARENVIKIMEQFFKPAGISVTCQFK